MKQYIDKSALVAEIEKWVSGWTERLNNTNPSNPSFFEGGIEVGKHILSFINTLEVKDIDEVIKTAEDHAYFAGSEAMRVKLIDKACDWLRIELVNFEDYIGMGETFIEDFKNYMKGE